MIKQIFEIEPIQKNSLLVYVAVCCISFLQLFIFKRDIIENNSFVAVGVVMSLGICWILAYSFVFRIFMETNYEFLKIEKYIFTDKTILVFGFLIIFWLIFLTYVGYELNMSFKFFIRLSLAFFIVKIIFWFIAGLLIGYRNRND